MKALLKQTGSNRNCAHPQGVRVLVVLLLVSGLAACSSTRLLYQNLDWLAFEVMDDRFEIRSDQEDWVKASLSELHGRHRVTQLPAYRLTLNELSARLANGLDAADMVWLDEQVEIHRRTLVDLVLPELARFLADLDDQQLARYAEASMEAIDEAAEQLDWPPQKRQAYRLETFVDRIEAWTGELSTAQLRVLEREVAALPDMRREWIAQRRERLLALTTLLATRPGADAIESALRGWWIDLDHSYPAAYVAKRNHLKRQVFGLLVSLDSGLTQPQRDKVADRLADYVSTIDIVVASR